MSYPNEHLDANAHMSYPNEHLDANAHMSYPNEHLDANVVHKRVVYRMGGGWRHHI